MNSQTGNQKPTVQMASRMCLKTGMVYPSAIYDFPHSEQVVVIFIENSLSSVFPRLTAPFSPCQRGWRRKRIA